VERHCRKERLSLDEWQWIGTHLESGVRKAIQTAEPSEKTISPLNGLKLHDKYDLEVTVSNKLSDIESASEILGSPVEYGIWLLRRRPRWFDGASTGTELDLVLLVVLLPFIFWRWAFSEKSGRQESTGPVFAAFSNDDLILFCGRDGFWRRRITSVELKRPLDELARVNIYTSKQTPVTFRFTGSPDTVLYYNGPRRALEEFVSRVT